MGEPSLHQDELEDLLEEAALVLSPDELYPQLLQSGYTSLRAIMLVEQTYGVGPSQVTIRRQATIHCQEKLLRHEKFCQREGCKYFKRQECEHHKCCERSEQQQGQEQQLDQQDRCDT
jgi:hypothetical protein